MKASHNPFWHASSAPFPVLFGTVNIACHWYRETGKWRCSDYSPRFSNISESQEDKRETPLFNKGMLDNYNMKTFGENLDFLLHKHKMTTTEFARQLDLPVKTVSEWIGVNGRTPRDLSILPKIAKIFDVSLRFLISGEEEDPIAELLQRTTKIYVGDHRITIEKLEPRSSV